MDTKAFSVSHSIVFLCIILLRIVVFTPWLMSSVYSFTLMLLYWVRIVIIVIVVVNVLGWRMTTTKLGFVMGSITYIFSKVLTKLLVVFETLLRVIEWEFSLVILLILLLMLVCIIVLIVILWLTIDV